MAGMCILHVVRFLTPALVVNLSLPDPADIAGAAHSSSGASIHMPKINGNEIRSGNVLEHNGGLWAAVKVEHVKPGKGGAFAQVELRNLRNGSKLNERFRSADKVERVRLEQKDQQFLYESDGMLVFMDSETFEQVELPEEEPPADETIPPEEEEAEPPEAREASASSISSPIVSFPVRSSARSERPTEPRRSTR